MTVKELREKLDELAPDDWADVEIEDQDSGYLMDVKEIYVDSDGALVIK